jgi:hypothetical protein
MTIVDFTITETVVGNNPPTRYTGGPIKLNVPLGNSVVLKGIGHSFFGGGPGGGSGTIGFVEWRVNGGAWTRAEQTHRDANTTVDWSVSTVIGEPKNYTFEFQCQDSSNDRKTIPPTTIPPQGGTVPS